MMKTTMCPVADDIQIPAGYLLGVQPWTWAHAERYDGDDFRAVGAARGRLQALGMSIGSMQSDAPIAAYKDVGDYVPKWRDLSNRERSKMDAAIVGDKRNGPVWILFREAPRG